MLQGKTALVTGSTSGIGLGIARKFAAQGANIVFNGFGDMKEIEALQANVKDEFGVKTAYHNADMSKPAEIEAMMRFAADQFGAVDVLVNNAGIQYVANVEDFPVEKWDAIIAINLSSAFHTTRLALPAMKERNWGRIINIASVHGLVGSAQKSAYVVAKHGMSNDEAKKSLLAEKQPSGEFVTPEQLGELAVFLSSEAASQVRGVAWNMDGGWVAQ
jgi:3-hydroxybutyrate dehydrogenase